MSFTFTLDLHPMEGRVHAVVPKVHALVQAVMARQVSVSTNFMKSNAPWTDRSGNARAGLHAEASGGGADQTLTLGHGVSYGIWLELRWAGRYAIIAQSVQQGGLDVMHLLEKGLSRI